MTRVSAQYGGVNLAQGFPNFPPPRVLVEAAHRALDGDFHQYAITWGARNLREAIAAKFERFYGPRIDPDRQVTVCCGSTEAMLSTLLAVLDPGDEIVLQPFYENYGRGRCHRGEAGLRAARATDFSFDPDRLARAFTRTKAIVSNCEQPDRQGFLARARGHLDCASERPRDHRRDLRA
jgi:aminotransferase